METDTPAPTTFSGVSPAPSRAKGIEVQQLPVPRGKLEIWRHMHERSLRLRDRLDVVEAEGTYPVFVYRWREPLEGFIRLLGTILGRQEDLGPTGWAQEMRKVIDEGHLPEEQVMIRLAQTLVGIEQAFRKHRV